MNIAFTTPLPAEGFSRLRGYQLKADPEIAEVLVSTFDKRVDREMISRMPRLRLIANFGAGYMPGARYPGDQYSDVGYRADGRVGLCAHDGRSPQRMSA